ncbi:BZ3500_MvSof-1268-A1-R1_Chr9g10523 [Microbotryum saponariae]|uniref:BZ3500_MvSof-1268-A1-R1_Chr9g10523 protein n=1 Tax=Microbotryum saponariae TaxID=289078 RepID=A0A2X0KTX9_9BASI|nr:BZ3501_MvSof-1269-A2-R1_Chr9g10272 [Microbotryum saponariae]SDA00235.1 BZ3500_MvSof-1268-A1-R1_Chr9g10523 [Microbotryum saponariae]
MSSTSTGASSTVLCSAQVAYKKDAGVLTLTPELLTFGSTSSSQPRLAITTARLLADFFLVPTRSAALFASKEGASKVQLRATLHPLAALPRHITLSPLDKADEAAYSFHFTAGASAISDREHFKKQLTHIIANNRELEANAALAPVDGATSSSNEPKGKGKEREVIDLTTNSTLSNRAGKTAAATAVNSSAAADFRLRKLVLQAHPNLMTLHRELVMSGQIAEAEFWEGREALLEQARAGEAQLRGKSAAMVDLRPETSESGEVTVKITPTQIADIFAECPMVLKAYNENVPVPLNDQEFWTRYFQSKLFNRNRTTNRSAVASVKDDAIFDKYLGEEDDDLEPKNLQHHDIYRLLDLAATEEDQHEVDIQPDVTMRAGRERAALPLMRRFNEHSERLLNQSLGNSVDRSRISFDPGNAGDRNYYDDILLDDLIDHAASDRIELNLSQQRNKLTAATSASELDEEGDAKMKMNELEMGQIVRRVKQEMEVWEPHLSEFHLDPAAINASMDDMTQSILLKVERNSRESTSSSGGIPRSTLDQCTTIAASANEFLRQFWSAVLPPKPGDISALASSTPVQKAARAERMKNGLDRTLERIRVVVQGLEEGSEVRARVESALLPVRESVETAITLFETRTS